MSTPQDYRLVISIGMGVVTIIFAIIGIIGYLFCQDDCKGSITLNLPDEGCVYIKQLFLEPEWASDLEAMRARGITVLVKSN